MSQVALTRVENAQEVLASLQVPTQQQRKPMLLTVFDSMDAVGEITAEGPKLISDWRMRQQNIWRAALADAGDQYKDEKLQDYLEVLCWRLCCIS